MYIVISEFDDSIQERETSKLVLILVFIGVLITFIGLIIGVTLSRYLSIPFIQLTEEIEHGNEPRELPFLDMTEVMKSVHLVGRLLTLRNDYIHF